MNEPLWKASHGRNVIPTHWSVRYDYGLVRGVPKKTRGKVFKKIITASAGVLKLFFFFFFFVIRAN